MHNRLSLVLLVFLVGCGGCNSESSVTRYGKPSPEADVPSPCNTASHERLTDEEKYAVTLAAKDNGGSISFDDIAVTRIKTLLAKLADTYDEEPLAIAAATYNTQELLRKSGIAQSNVEMMAAMNTIFPPLAAKSQDYAKTLAVYCTLRDEGYSHAESVDTLRQFVWSLVNWGAELKAALRDRDEDVN